MFKLITNSAMLFFTRSAQSLFGLLIAILVSRNMATELLASTLVLLSIAIFCGKIGVFGVDIITIKSLGKTNADPVLVRDCTNKLFGCFLLLWGGAVPIVYIILLTLGLPPTGMLWNTYIWSITLWIFLISLQTFQASILLGLNRQIPSLLYNGSLSNGITATIAYLFILQYGALSVAQVVIAYVIGSLLSVILAQLHIHRIIGSMIPLFSRAADDATQLKRIGPSALLNSLSMTAEQIPLWILTVIGTDNDIVAYALAYRLILPLAIIVLAAKTMVSPIVAQALHNRTLTEAEPRLREIATMSTLAAFSVSIGLLSTCGWIFDELFRRPEATNLLVLSTLLCGQMCFCFFGNGLLMLRLSDQIRFAMFIVLISVFFLTVSVTGLYWSFGVNGVAMAVALYWSSVTISSSLKVKHSLGIRISAIMPQLKFTHS